MNSLFMCHCSNKFIASISLMSILLFQMLPKVWQLENLRIYFKEMTCNRQILPFPVPNVTEPHIQGWCDSHRNTMSGIVSRFNEWIMWINSGKCNQH